MHSKTSPLLLTSLIISLVMILGACQRAPTPSPSPLSPTQAPLETSSRPLDVTTTPAGGMPTEPPYPLPTLPVAPYPQPSGQTGAPELSSTPYPGPQVTSTQATTPQPQVSQTLLAATPSATATDSPTPGASPTQAAGQPYPGPLNTPTTPGYPGPVISPTSPGYPGPTTPTLRPTNTQQTPGAPSPTSTATSSPTARFTPGIGTPQVTPTEMPPQPPLEPPPAASNISIWHSWSAFETIMLQMIIDSFQQLYPDVTFSLQFIPEDELFRRYHDAAYFGQGPSLLLGSSAWGAELSQDSMVIDLSAFIPPDYLIDINKAAIASGRIGDLQVSLPLSLRGLVMYRNADVMPDAPASFNDLIALSHQATRAGMVGSYLERGAYFSAPNIIGLGGSLMSEGDFPVFDDQYGLEWLELLAAYDEAGAVTFNTNYDLEMFKRGRVGIIIDGTWNLTNLAQAIGAENLAIDPWPTYGSGQMSGWVEADSAYVNSNLAGDDLNASLSFIGYLLDPMVQMHLAEVGHIPSVLTAQPRDPLIEQAMQALSGGVAFPNTTDDHILNSYWEQLNIALEDVFERGADPTIALQNASENLTRIIRELQTAP